MERGWILKGSIVPLYWMFQELWYRGLTAQSTVEREAARLSDIFRDRRPHPMVAVTKKNHIFIGLVGYGMVVNPDEGGGYIVIKVGGKFDTNQEEIQNYELFPGQTVPLANLVRFVHDYTEAEEWERI